MYNGLRESDKRSLFWLVDKERKMESKGKLSEIQLSSSNPMVVPLSLPGESDTTRIMVANLKTLDGLGLVSFTCTPRDLWHGNVTPEGRAYYDLQHMPWWKRALASVGGHLMGDVRKVLIGVIIGVIVTLVGAWLLGWLTSIGVIPKP